MSYWQPKNLKEPFKEGDKVVITLCNTTLVGLTSGTVGTVKFVEEANTSSQVTFALVDRDVHFWVDEQGWLARGEDVYFRVEKLTP